MHSSDQISCIQVCQPSSPIHSQMVAGGGTRIGTLSSSPSKTSTLCTSRGLSVAPTPLQQIGESKEVWDLAEGLNDDKEAEGPLYSHLSNQPRQLSKVKTTALPTSKVHYLGLLILEAIQTLHCPIDNWTVIQIKQLSSLRHALPQYHPHLHFFHPTTDPP